MNNKTKISIALFSAIVLPLQLMAVNVGVAGSISAFRNSDSGSATSVDDLRLKVAESINDSTQVNIVADIESGLTVKEGYLTFAKPMSTFGINKELKGLSVVAGQKLVSFGLNNTRYTEDRTFIGTPMAINAVTGTDGLVGKGLEVGYTADIMIPITLKAGYFIDTMSKDDEGMSVTNADNTMTVRAGLEKENYSVGVSYLATDSDDAFSAFDVDGAVNFDLGTGTVKVEGEFVSATYDSLDAESGIYAYAGYDWKNDRTTGVVYDSLTTENDPDADDYSAVGLVVTRELSKSAKLRAQYMSNSNDRDDSQISAQIVFNLQ